ncbi:MAG: hypothetical protein ACHQPI_06215 [Thermoanaerobaculia bacterium]
MGRPSPRVRLREVRIRDSNAGFLFPVVAISLLASSYPAKAGGEDPGRSGDLPSTKEAHAAPSDLSLADFFTRGWNEEWTHRERFTPDMALLRVTTNFLEREFRADYSRTDVRGNPSLDTTQMANGLIAYGLNRRLMLEVISNYQWNLSNGDVTASGGGGGALVRTQLVDTATSSAALQVKVAFPNKGIGQTQTSLTYALAAWQDLHTLLPALGRVGLYESIQLESLQGPSKPGARTSDLSGDISLAKTWTGPDTPGFGNFTTFVEFFATRDLNGDSSGQTIASITPGIRTWFARKNSVTLGVDLPLGRPGSFYRVLRATYILNF